MLVRSALSPAPAELLILKADRVTYEIPIDVEGPSKNVCFRSFAKTFFTNVDMHLARLTPLFQLSKKPEDSLLCSSSIPNYCGNQGCLCCGGILIDGDIYPGLPINNSTVLSFDTRSNRIFFTNCHKSSTPYELEINIPAFRDVVKQLSLVIK